MTPIAAEILRQRQRIINANRKPAKAIIGIELQPDLYCDEHLVVGMYAGPGVVESDRIFGIPVEYTTEPGRLEMIRVIPEGWEGEGQGATRGGR